jgi:5'-3' exonuclease
MLQLMGLPEETDTKSLYTMDISMLSNSIVYDMECGDANLTRIYDYVFICFLLGNDFLPHFPSLNIRTHGIQILLDTYRKTLGNKPNCYIVDDDKINWKYFLMFLQEFANIKWGVNKNWNHSREYANLEEELLNVPVMFREKELYISPQYPHWENRYYETLFNDGSLKRELLNKNPENIRRCICYNYLEGLEWVLKYYKCGHVDWSWYYQYNYAPLLIDVFKYAVEYKSSMTAVNDLKICKKGVIKNKILLMYVSPIETWCELGIYDFVINKLEKETINKYFSKIDELEFEWAFCRYFWESKVVYKKIPIELLEHLNNI